MFRVIVWAMIVGVFLVLLVVFNTLSGLVVARSGNAYATAITVVLKMGFWLGGLALLFPVGLADLLLAINKNVHEPQGFDVLTTSSTGKRINTARRGGLRDGAAVNVSGFRIVGGSRPGTVRRGPF